MEVFNFNMSCIHSLWNIVCYKGFAYNAWSNVWKKTAASLKLASGIEKKPDCSLKTLAKNW